MILSVNYIRRKKQETVKFQLDKTSNENNIISEKDKEILELKKNVASLEKQLKENKIESSIPKNENNIFEKKEVDKKENEKIETTEEKKGNSFKEIEMKKKKEIKRKRNLKEKKKKKRKKEKYEEQKKYAERFPKAIISSKIKKNEE